MKQFMTCVLICLVTSLGFAQTNASVDCNCPIPITGKFVQLELMVENQDLNFTEVLIDMACADRIADSPAVIKSKVNCMWNKYYAEFGCNSTGFLIANGNILKYAVNQEFVFFVDAMIKDFGIDINKKDPSDGKTLLDFVQDEINRYKKDKNYQHKIKELQIIYERFKNQYSALHAYQL